MAFTTSAVPLFSESTGGLDAHLQPLRTVVVDDDREMVCAIQAFLEFSCQAETVGTATNGRLAIELVDSMRPDLVVMDINMPVMDGLMATVHIKNLLPEVKILIMSGDDDDDTALAALAAGADGFMPKGNIQMLGQHVARLFPQKFFVD